MGALKILLFSTPTFRSEGRKKIPHNSEKELQGIERSYLASLFALIVTTTIIMVKVARANKIA